MSSIIFGGGCFWCVEAIFKRLRGVTKVVSGYAGGTISKPDYEAVCSGKTGHAEVIKVEFDPAKITLDQLLAVFFSSHDPTTVDRQGNDVGEQYRSVVFYSDEAQKQMIEKYLENLTREKTFDEPIVTQVEKAPEFFPAEDYHQNYYDSNPQNPYCQMVISPKIAKLREKFLPLLKE